jgi:hypothetical protein
MESCNLNVILGFYDALSGLIGGFFYKNLCLARNARNLTNFDFLDIQLLNGVVQIKPVIDNVVGVLAIQREDKFLPLTIPGIIPCTTEEMDTGMFGLFVK